MRQANVNCLYGLACPTCGSFEPFELVITALATIYDSGIDDYNVLEWDSDNLCRCPLCGYCGTVADFRDGKGGAL
jgi:hypothetical protein